MSEHFIRFGGSLSPDITGSHLRARGKPEGKSERSRRHSLKERVVRVVSGLPFVDTPLAKRAEKIVEANMVAKYLRPKIKFVRQEAESVFPTKVENGLNILCIGAGKGHEMDEIDMQLPGSTIKGVDPHDGATYAVEDRFKNLAHDAKFESPEIKAENLANTPDKSVDGVTMFFVMHDIDQLKYGQIMDELYRVTKDDGKIFIAEDLVDNEGERSTAEKIHKRLNAKPLSRVKHHFKNVGGWQKFFRQHGFNVLETSEQKPKKVRHGFFVLEKISEEQRKKLSPLNLAEKK